MSFASLKRACVVLGVAATFAAVARGEDEDLEIEARKMEFAERAGNLAVTTSIADLFDEAAYEELGSGVASVVVVRFYVHAKGEVEPTAFALAKIRVVYDHWDEKYTIKVEGPLGSFQTVATRRSDALREVTSLEKFPIAPLSRIPIGPHFVLSMVVELNPVSAELLAEVRRWLTKPAGQERLDAGSSFFGSFVSVFVNPKLAEADRVIKYRSQPFYRVEQTKSSR